MSEFVHSEAGPYSEVWYCTDNCEDRPARWDGSYRLLRGRWLGKQQAGARGTLYQLIEKVERKSASSIAQTDQQTNRISSGQLRSPRWLNAE